ncbi:glycosyltransferase family 4 protein [uncultured Bacteroides sp.]|uniref:glycosyltransferase family 4 protein n=1 Tax=uncultured Bacteroides sp. TaxID=162156 RepID=UPI002AA6FC21|nr:glycosyltransferase family 4 protein [uncultured Bacteroides sp.]
MRKLKICFYCDSIFSFGGVQRVLAVIAKSLSTNYEVTILTHDNPSQEDKSMYGLGESDLKFEYINYPSLPFYEYLPCKTYSFLYKKVLIQNKITSKWYGYSSFPHSKRKILIKKINNGNYDIVIGVHAFLSLHLASIVKYIKPKVIGWMHNSYSAFFENRGLFLWNQKKQFQYEIPRLNAVVVLTKSDRELYNKNMNIDAISIYNPLTLAPIGKGNSKFRKFLAIGRFSHLAKGFDILIEAFALFAKHTPDWTLDIVGEGPEEDKLRKLIYKYELENRINILPFTKNIQKHYASASIFVLSSRWEGFGLVLVEAMAHYLPIIASDLPVVKELLGETDNCLIFRNEDVNDLAAKMLFIVKREDLDEMGEKSYAIAKTFQIDNIIQQWENIITEISN